MDDLTAVALYDKPRLKFERILETYLGVVPRGVRSVLMAGPLWLREKLFMDRLIRKALGYRGTSSAATVSPVRSLSHSGRGTRRVTGRRSYRRFTRLLHNGLQSLHATWHYLGLPRAAKAERRRDAKGLPPEDPGSDRVIRQGMAWLGRAQDSSASHDGGVAYHFSLLTGWGPSYPETTGYIIPTFLEYSALRGDTRLRERARRMLDWLVSLQGPDGSFQGGPVGATPAVPVTFNTGQILLGLASGAREFGEPYGEAMRRAAEWLVRTQDPDGCWRRYPSPFATLGEKTYDTHVAWGLLEAARLEPHERYAEAALANILWALGLQRSNGWLDKCCLANPSKPLTHTLGYALHGLVKAYVFSKDPELLQACLKMADGLLLALGPDGFLPGRLRPDWRGAVPWACLTGSAQIACCWLLLYRHTGNPRYLNAATAVNRYVRRTVKVDGLPETRGAVKGSFPVSGGYAPYRYPNWACKFLLDALLLERTVA